MGRKREVYGRLYEGLGREPVRMISFVVKFEHLPRRFLLFRTPIPISPVMKDKRLDGPGTVAKKPWMVPDESLSKIPTRSPASFIPEIAVLIEPGTSMIVKVPLL